MNIKMIVMDLDDTLLRNDKTISDRTAATLMKCRGMGIKVVYATARGPSAQSVVPPELFDGRIQMCGAMAYADETLVYNKLISTVDARELLLMADKASIKIAVEAKGWHYANFDFPDDWDPIYREFYEVTNFSTLDINAEKFYALPETDEEIDLLLRYTPKGLKTTVARHNFTMIVNEDASKSKAIEALAAFWGINSSEVVAFGDDVIDICMIQYSSIGVAMSNAVDEVKAVANQICDTNENDGVAKWIEQNVLKRVK